MENTGHYVYQTKTGDSPFKVTGLGSFPKEAMTTTQAKVDGPQKETFADTLDKTYPQISEAFKAVLYDQMNLFAKKHLDYGIWNLAAGTRLETAQDIGFALEGIWFRLSDKVNRWRNIMLTGNVNNESLQDTFKDIANYAMIAQIIASGNWKE